MHPCIFFSLLFSDSNDKNTFEIFFSNLRCKLRSYKVFVYPVFCINCFMRNKNSFSTYIKLGLPLRQGGKDLQNLLQYSAFFFSPFKFQFEVQHRVQLRVRTHPVELWCWSLARAAIMRHHKLGSKNNRNVLVSAVEAEQAKAKGY